MRALIKIAIVVIILFCAIKIIFNFIDNTAEELSNGIYHSNLHGGGIYSNDGILPQLKTMPSQPKR